MINYSIFISTGEVSGDFQGAALVQALYAEAQRQNIPIEISALGGEKMEAAGATLLGNTAGIGSIGLLEALPFLLPAFLLQQRVKRHLLSHPPHLAVLIDYVAPNIAMGQFLKARLGIPIVYYIAPQEWVWEFQNNTQLITRFTDRILSIFPAEAAYYQTKGANVTWVGHPLIELMAQVPDRLTARKSLNIPATTPMVALLPASRTQELKLLLPTMLKAATILQQRLPDIQFWLPISRSSYRSEIEQILQQFNLTVHLVEGNPHVVIRAADVAMAKSGTVNLETALLGVPQVVLYRVSALTAWVARKIFGFKIPFMSPPNLVLMEEIVPEFFQEKAQPEPIAEACWEFLTQGAKQSDLATKYQQVREALGDGNATTKAATAILETLRASFA